MDRAQVCLASFAATGLAQIWLAFDEPHNLSTGGFGDYDARFAAGKFRNTVVLALGAAGLLPLTYSIGYIRLQGDERPSYLRAVEVAHYWLECLPQMFVCLGVGALS